MKANVGATISKNHPHARRIQTELREAGVTVYGMLKFVPHYLPRVLHEDEHIEAVVYGRYHDDGDGWLNMNEGWLVATDYRVLFIDYKPGFTHIDEISYDIVAGVQISRAWPSSAITLHTKIGRFSILYVNRRCADRFMDAIEDRRLVKAREGMFLRPYQSLMKAPTESAVSTAGIDPVAMEYFRSHDIAILSTVGRNGETHDTTVYYLVDENSNIYVLTKDNTQRVLDVLAEPHVALIAYDADKAEMVELEGMCEVETEQSKKDWVFRMFTKLQSYGTISALPQVTSLQNGLYTIFRILPTKARFMDYLNDLGAVALRQPAL